jgi:hypothetical protein
LDALIKSYIAAADLTIAAPRYEVGNDKTGMLK